MGDLCGGGAGRGALLVAGEDGGFAPLEGYGGVGGVAGDEVGLVGDEAVAGSEKLLVVRSEWLGRADRRTAELSKAACWQLRGVELRAATAAASCGPKSQDRDMGHPNFAGFGFSAQLYRASLGLSWR